MLLLTKFFDMSIQYVRPNIHMSALNHMTELPGLNLVDISTTTEEFLSVVKVVDGDTIDVMENGMKVRVRLIGINTPETVDPRRIVECFGKEASQKTKGLLSNGIVKLVGDLSQGDTDKYDRRLAYVFTSDGTFVNLELVKQGYAYEYTYRTPYKYQTEFREAERNAREAGRGLWAPGMCDTSKHRVQ